jgi:hypothetical protein
MPLTGGDVAKIEAGYFAGPVNLGGVGIAWY